MRVGRNPAKDHQRLSGFGSMRVVVPVYVPHVTGYFARMIDVVELCLDSLWRTKADSTLVTVVANGCCEEMLDVLRARSDAGQLDQLIVNQENRGKVDSTLAVARGAWEEWILISDCDALFLPGWHAEVSATLRSFPRCAFLGLSPAPNLVLYHTSSTVVGAALTGQLRVGRVVDMESAQAFSRSVDSDAVFESSARRHLYVRGGDIRAVVGAGHFCFVARREMLRSGPDYPSREALNGRADAEWLDAPCDQMGGWRLSTPRAWVLHIGNVPEPWMRPATALPSPSPTPDEGLGVADNAWVPGVSLSPRVLRLVHRVSALTLKLLGVR